MFRPGYLPLHKSSADNYPLNVCPLSVTAYGLLVFLLVLHVTLNSVM